MRMPANTLLEEKRRTQKHMAREADYNVKNLHDNVDKIVKEMADEYGITLKYANLKPSIDKRTVKGRNKCG
ncbi:MAG: hypothetical protein WAX69_05175 [Victivallales bacterium]